MLDDDQMMMRENHFTFSKFMYMFVDVDVNLPRAKE